MIILSPYLTYSTYSAYITYFPVSPTTPVIATCLPTLKNKLRHREALHPATVRIPNDTPCKSAAIYRCWKNRADTSPVMLSAAKHLKPDSSLRCVTVFIPPPPYTTYTTYSTYLPSAPEKLFIVC